MSNDKDFKVKNGIQPTVYQEGLGTIATGSVTVGYDLSVAAYDSKSLSVASEEAAPSDVSINPDGTKMYLLGSNNRNVYQYTLSTAYDLSTASYDSVSFLVGSQETAPKGFYFKPDGTKMYVVGTTSDSVFQYSLSTAWDLSTTSYDSVSFSVSSQSSAPYGLTFKSDGTNFYISDAASNDIFEYTLSTAWDLTSTSYTQSFDASSGGTETSQEVAFKSDGTAMYVLDGFNRELEEYALSTAWDISTASFVQSFNMASEDTNPTGITFNYDGSKMYMVGDITDTIYQYTTGSTLTTNTLDLSTGNAFQITPTSNIQVGLSNPAASGTVSQATLLLDGAVNGYDLSGAAYDSVSFSVSSQEADPTEIAFNNDGTKMYVMGLDSGCVVYQYSLSTAFDVSTASYDSVSFSVNSQSPYSYGLSFNDDGTKMYVLGNTGSIYQYSLSTAFDLSTASYDSVSFNASSQDVNTYAITFNNNGTKMYVSGAGAPASIYQYSLSTAFNLSTAGYDSVSLNVSSQETSPYGLKFNSDGTKVYVSGFSSDSIHQYSLSTAFDLSTASYDSVSFSVSSQATVHYALTFSADGSKMHILSSTQNVFQYSTGSAYTATYDSTIQFGGGTAPDSPLANETDVLTFSTRDGGTTYQAAQAIDGAV
jgi:DNA-binding beta-propeller fold protein YncE